MVYAVYEVTDEWATASFLCSIYYTHGFLLWNSNIYIDKIIKLTPYISRKITNKAVPHSLVKSEQYFVHLKWNPRIL